MTQTQKRQGYIDELLAYIEPERIGADYAAALARGDRKAALALYAAYCRTRPFPVAVTQDEKADYDPDVARRRTEGQMREVNIDYAFPDGRVNFLFNPTLEQPPVNHEWLWQLSRHMWWPDMAKAYAATGDEAYAAAFCTQLLDWIDQTALPETGWNDPGSAWRTIECGLRLRAPWPIAFRLFRTSPSVTDEALLLMTAAMHRQAQHLIAHPMFGNWLMIESNGAYTFGALFPEFKDAAAIRTEAAKRVAAEVETQILPDGFHNELSPDYHWVVFHSVHGVYRAAQATGNEAELPASFRRYLREMALCAVQMSTPGFTQPRTNDCYTLSTREIAGDVAPLFPEDPVFAYVVGDRKTGTPPTGTSCFLPYAGFAVMRSGWDAEAAYLCFDVGPLGMGHMHQDKLNIHVYKGGEELIFDDGGGQYEESPQRQYALSAYDHNTVIVDGLAQQRKEPLKMTEPIDAGFVTNDRFDYACGVYDGPFGDQYPAVHRREVRFCKPSFFVVRDTLTSSDGAPHTYEVRFHLDTVHSEPVPGMPGAVLADYGRRWRLLLVPLTEPGETESETRAVSGQTEPELLGWYIGRNEAHNHPALTVLRQATAAVHHFTTLLIPLDKNDPLPAVQPQADGTVQIGIAGETYTFDRHALNE